MIPQTDGARVQAGRTLLRALEVSSAITVGLAVLAVPAAGQGTNNTTVLPDASGFQGELRLVLPVLVLATALLVGWIFAANRLHGRLVDRARAIGRGPEREMRLGSFRIRSTAWIRSGLAHLIDLARATLVIVALGVYIPFALSLFAPTAGLARRTLELAGRNLETFREGVVAYLPNIIFIVLVGLITWGLLKVLKAVFVEIRRGHISIRGFYPSWAEPTFVLLRVAVLALVLVLILPKLPGFGSAAFEGISLFLGALVALGASSAMANAISGVVLTYTRAFDIGDRVRIADTLGDVVERTLLVTRVRTNKNEDITVPNAQVLSNHIVNYSGLSEERPLIVPTEVSIGYDVAWREVHVLLLEAAGRTDGVLGEPEPFVLQTELGDFAITYELNVYTHQPGSMARIRSSLHQNILDVFAEADVEILSPAHTAFREHEVLPPRELAPTPQERGAAAGEGEVVPDAGEIPDLERQRLEEAEREAEADEAAEEAWTQEGDEGDLGREADPADETDEDEPRPGTQDQASEDEEGEDA